MGKVKIKLSPHFLPPPRDFPVFSVEVVGAKDGALSLVHSLEREREASVGGVADYFLVQLGRDFQKSVISDAKKMATGKMSTGNFLGEFFFF